MGPLWRIVFVAAIVAIACASPARAESYLGLTFPEQIGGAKLGEIHNYEKEQPGYGYSGAYDRPGWAIDVYIYDLGMSDISDDPLSEVVLRELVQAKGEILEVGRQGYYTDIKVKDEFVLKDAHGKALCLHVVWLRRCEARCRQRAVPHRVEAQVPQVPDDHGASRRQRSRSGELCRRLGRDALAVTIGAAR